MFINILGPEPGGDALHDEQVAEREVALVAAFVEDGHRRERFAGKNQALSTACAGLKWTVRPSVAPCWPNWNSHVSNPFSTRFHLAPPLCSTFSFSYRWPFL